MAKIRKAVGIGLMVAAGAAGVSSQAAEAWGCEGNVEMIGDLNTPHCEGNIEGLYGDVHDMGKVVFYLGVAAGGGLLMLENRGKEEESPALQEESAESHLS